MTRFVQAGTSEFRTVSKETLEQLIRAIEPVDVPTIEMRTTRGWLEVSHAANGAFGLSHWLNLDNVRCALRRDFNQIEARGILLDYWANRTWDQGIEWRRVEWPRPGSVHERRVLRTVVRPQLARLQGSANELSPAKKRWLFRSLARRTVSSASERAALGRFRLLNDETERDLELWIYALFLKEAGEWTPVVQPEWNNRSD